VQDAAGARGEFAVISFDVDAGHFHCRVVGVCLQAEHVLLQRAVTEDFWALPGGRLELLEDSRTALIREMWEELGVEITCGRLLWVVENFFSFAGRAFHELAFYYVMTLPADEPLLDVQRVHPGIEPENPLEFRWFPVERLAEVRLNPTIMRTALREVPATIQHLIHTDEPD
jgi:8-oxo-dGTP pyrophosphatase MutT (NUDIX family)